MFLTNLSKGIILTVLTSLYFFPFEFTFLPGVNTKMMMAAAGLVFLIIQLAKQEKKAEVGHEILMLSLFAASVSIIGWISITVNNTPDTAYANYLISMWVWLGSAYMLVSTIRQLHRHLSVVLLVNYLIAVCVLQCVLALVIDSLPAIKAVVDTYIEQGQEFLNQINVKRLYGIGASLDVAGSRFAAVLIMIAFVTTTIEKTSLQRYLPLYLICFFAIAIVGNMIARTTTVGLGLAIFCWLITANISQIKGNTFTHYRLWGWMALILVIVTGVTVFLYNTNPDVAKKMRFAFEGFFSLFEQGKWEVSSNDKLKAMYVFPDNLKTWIIGDGYFSNPRDVDLFFIGKETGGYYMGTDVGYLRFIFYFGIIGLIAMMTFVCKAGAYCIKNLAKYKLMFVLLLLANFIIWFKVSTDIFLVFALFLMIQGNEQKQFDEENSIEK